MKAALPAALALLLAACGAGGVDSGCSGSCATVTPQQLTVADVQQVLAQGITEAQSRQAAGTLVVVDRVGNVLAVFRMNSAHPGLLKVDSGRGVSGGLDGIEFRALLTQLSYPDVQKGVEGVAALMAVSKAISGAYLSSEGNAFSTRTASQIVQQFFNPGEQDQPGGPLFGVQFSQLPCSDVLARFNGTRPTPGPHRSPLGLSADAGGFPLYKQGTLVGGVGVMADDVYGLDLDISNTDLDLDELIALAATRGFEPPVDRRADRITVDGKTLRYSDATPANLLSGSTPAFVTLDGIVGQLGALPGYTGSSSAIVAGLPFGTPASGVRAAIDSFATRDGFQLVNASNNVRYEPMSGTDQATVGTAVLSANEVRGLLEAALEQSNRLRAQIRRPLGSAARVSIAVTDSDGTVLGLVRGRDAPLFGTDVAVQKARSAAFFTHEDADEDLEAAPGITYLGNGASASISDRLKATREFFNAPELLNGKQAWSSRAIGNIARPYFPDGLTVTDPGPLSKPIAQWSPFDVGLELDLSYNAVVQHLLFVLGAGLDVAAGACTALPTPSGKTQSRLGNGLQIFAGGVPLYRDNKLVGAMGISGDGIDQDDLIAFLGVHDGGINLGNGLGNAPKAIRVDQLVKEGVSPRYVQCPQAPYNGSSEQAPCAGK